MIKNIFHLCVIFVASVLFCTSGFSQEVQGTISGTVSDQSGAVVSGAKVVIHRVDTDTDERTVMTDGSGNYTATNIPPSNYTVTVTASGFKAFTAKNVTVNVSQKLNVSAQLQAGAATETVTVEENPISLQTETAAQSTTITGTQVRELELNNRNFEQLVTLQPGVVNNLGDEPGYGLNSTTDVSVNGVRGTGNNWTVDGADINDSGSNGTLLNIPSVDAIQEFTLERSQYDASFGRSAGAQVMVATKAGTREFHGDAYEFVRNDWFNANTFLANASDQPRAVERYNNFGFTIGGPLYIPKVYNTNKDKTYFFWSEEWRKVSSPNTIDIPAASPAMLNGLVAGQVSAPAGCAVYTKATDTTQINPACFSANAKVYISNILSKFTANNAVSDATGGNYISTYSALNNFRQDIVRFDYDITSKLKFYARYMKDTIPSNVPTGLWGGNNFPGVVNVALQVPGTNAVGNLSYVISPTMVNEFEFAYSEGGIESALSGAAVDQSIISQLSNNFAYNDPYSRLPSINITGYTGVSEGSSPYHEANLDRNIFDNFTWTLHNHTIRAGATVQWMLKSENSSGGDSSFTFNSFGDFLVGNVALYQQNNRDIIPDLRYKNFEAYVQDDWKVTPRLTLNLGMRYSYFPGPSDYANTLSNFSPALFNAAKAPLLDGTGSFVAGQSVVPATYTNGLIFPTGSACTQAQSIAPLTSCSPYGSGVNPNSNLNFAPRVGFAYTVDNTGRTVLRGGFGIFYDRTLNGMWEQNAFTNPPLVQQAYVQNTTFDNPLGVAGSAPLGPQAIETTGTPDLKVPSYNTYNLSVQQAIDRATTFEIAYVGSQGRHLLGEVDRNQPTLAAREANPDVNVNDVRPYLGYNYIKNRFTGFTSNYNSLQLSINHHVANGLTIGASYTWSRTLGDAEADRDIAANNTYNLHDSYGPTSFNEPQIFVVNYVYDLPFFKEQHGLLGHTLGGWEVSGITTVESGMSNTITQSNDPFACPNTSATTGACVALTDDQGNVTVPIPPGTYPGGLGMGTSGDGSVQIRADQAGPVHLSKKLNAATNEWIAPTSFTTASAHFGSSRVGSVYGPGEQNWDIGAMKNVKFAERYSLQIRGEFFNAFNHTNPSGFDTSVSDSTFGQVTATHNPREIQLGAKLYF
ncbi:carboxypeptidase regulatory-like domain-containing protein [Silvibacterium acidisoli]|uniref:carboxypeptidase regulatory-like domain-containing protein n=1 Tax=Acidobacteriaceae bacterium ZG23-2 TaxID=2883246 RepID=UPI00406C1D9F